MKFPLRDSLENNCSRRMNSRLQRREVRLRGLEHFHSRTSLITIGAAVAGLLLPLTVAAQTIDIPIGAPTLRIGSGVNLQTGEYGQGQAFKTLDPDQITSLPAGAESFNLESALSIVEESRFRSKYISVGLRGRYLLARGGVDSAWQEMSRTAESSISFRVRATYLFGSQSARNDFDEAMLSPGAKEMLQKLREAKEAQNALQASRLIDQWERRYGTHFVSEVFKASRIEFDAALQTFSREFQSTLVGKMDIAVGSLMWSAKLNAQLQSMIHNEMQKGTVRFRVLTEGAGRYTGPLSPKSIDQIEEATKKLLEQTNSDTARVSRVQIRPYDSVFPELSRGSAFEDDVSAFSMVSSIIGLKALFHSWKSEPCLSNSGQERLEASIEEIDGIARKMLSELKETNQISEVTIRQLTRTKKLWMPSTTPQYQFGRGNVIGRPNDPWILVGMPGWDLTKLRIFSGGRDPERPCTEPIDNPPTDVLMRYFGQEARFRAWGDLQPHSQTSVPIEIKRLDGTLVYRGVYIPNY